MPTAIQTKATTYISRVFGWMFYAMTLSGISSVLVYSSDALQKVLFENSTVSYILIILQLGAVFGLSLLVNKINGFVALILFTLYSVLTGLTLSSLLFLYDIKMLSGAFLMTAGIYGVMSIIGFTTKVNLSSLRVFFLMSLFGIVIASLVNIFLQSSGLDLILSYAAIFLFSGLTAYDMQRIKETSSFGYVENKYAIIDALSMYLNFINIFVNIVRILDRD